MNRRWISRLLNLGPGLSNMKQKIIMYTFPILSVASVFLLDCLAYGVDFGAYIENGGDRLCITVTNAPLCCELEWSNDLIAWKRNVRVEAFEEVDNWKNFRYTVSTNHQRSFWRVKDCAAQ
jgi:hypothetical protein